jgi:hypothetical protein
LKRAAPDFPRNRKRLSESSLSWDLPEPFEEKDSPDGAGSAGSMIRG